MSVTSPSRPEVVTRGVASRRLAWIERMTDTDHKSVATLYIGTAFSFLALAVTLLVLTRIQLLVPQNSIIAPEVFNRLYSVLGVSAVVLFALPLALGLWSYVAPLQIGARGVAFPRLGLLSYFLFLFGGVTIFATFLYTPSDAGPLALPPLSSEVYNPVAGVDGWIAGMILALLGFTLLAINLLVTLRGMRAPGMAWRRTPLLSWSATMGAGVMLVVGPVMLAALAMLLIDRQFGGEWFDSGDGGAPLLYEHLGFLFFTGAWAIVLLFAVGVISEIVPTMARKPSFSHRGAIAAIATIGPLALLAWAQNLYEAPIGIGVQVTAMIFALSLAIPVGLLVFNWIATLWGGAVRTGAPTLFTLAAISTLSIGLVLELALSVIPVGWQLDNTAFAEGATAYTLVGGAVLAGFAAMHYWMPKITGRYVGEGLAKAALGLILAGTHLFALPLLLAGLDGQPAGVFEYYGEASGIDMGVSTLNLVASFGAFVLAIGIFLGLGNLAYGYRNGNRAGHDPWGGSTLEWFALSPPPPHNFDAIPDVRSHEPLRDIRDAVRARAIGERASARGARGRDGDGGSDGQGARRGSVA